jgi:hypothetical protein
MMWFVLQPACRPKGTERDDKDQTIISQHNTIVPDGIINYEKKSSLFDVSK